MSPIAYSTHKKLATSADVLLSGLWYRIYSPELTRANEVCAVASARAELTHPLSLLKAVKGLVSIAGHAASSAVAALFPESFSVSAGAASSLEDVTS